MNVPSFRFSVPSFRFLYPRSGFRGLGNIRQNHPFGNHLFANPRSSLAGSNHQIRTPTPSKCIFSLILSVWFFRKRGLTKFLGLAGPFACIFFGKSTTPPLKNTTYTKKSQSPEVGHNEAGRSDFQNQRFEPNTGKMQKRRKVPSR